LGKAEVLLPSAFPLRHPREVAGMIHETILKEKIVRDLQIVKMSPIFNFKPISSYLKTASNMKTALRKLGTHNKSLIFRSFIFSLLFISFFVFVLYILINSPA
jgi:hypothetical protein